MTNAEFSQIVAYMAKNCAHWAGDALSLPERINSPMSEENRRRFVAEMRERLDRIDPDTRAELPPRGYSGNLLVRP